MVSDINNLKINISDFCKNNPKKVLFLKKLNGKRDYKELAKLCGVNTPNNCIPWINEGEGLKLIIMDGKTGLPQKCTLLKGKNVDSLVKGIHNKKTISIRKKNIVDIKVVKKIFRKYLLDNFKKIENYYEKDKYSELKDKEIEVIINKISLLLENKKKTFETEGLEIRFFTAFGDYFNERRTEPSSMFNKFSSVVKIYEPLLKKFLIIKTNDEKWSKKSLDENMIITAYGIKDANFNIKEMKEDYWKRRTPKESAIRIAYRYRNIESHSATELKSYEMDKIVYFIFAAIIFLFKRN